MDPKKIETKFETKFEAIPKRTTDQSVDALSEYAVVWMDKLKKHLIDRNGIYEGTIVPKS
jgi:hypothetical protein